MIGNMYVVEQCNSRIQVLTAQGQHIRNIGDRPGELADPISIVVHKGMVYVTDIRSKSKNGVSVFMTTGVRFPS